MSGVTSREARFAFAKFATNSWGVAASVLHGTYFASDGGAAHVPMRSNDEAFGQAFLGAGDFGDTTAVEPTFTGRDRYNDKNYILEALAMGSPAAVTISTSAAGQVTSWQHITDLATNIDGLGATFAADKVHFVDELTSAKIHGFSQAVGDAGVMDASFKVIGTGMTHISSVNTRSTVNGANYVPLDNRVFKKQGVFRLNKQSDSALASGDALAAENISFDFDRPQDAPHVFGQAFIYEPADNGFPVVKLTVTFPRMTLTLSNSLNQALRDSPTWKADWIFTGVLINSTDTFTKKYQFPALELDEFSTPLSGPNQVKPQATFTAKLAASSPAGMPFVRPFRLTRIMTNSTVAF
jgi:hypothetical protein